MFPLLTLNKRGLTRKGGVGAGAIVALCLTLTPGAIAHQVKTSAEVGGTLHIEPDDRPRAGEPTVAWFLLQRKGGTPFDLEECACEVQLYKSSASGTAVPLQTLTLKPLTIADSGVASAPGTDVTFPEVGTYELVVKGQPKTEDAFTPFELRFPVTVAQGEAVPPTATPLPSPVPPTATPAETTPASSVTSTNATQGNSGAIAVAATLSVLVAGGLLWKLKSR